MYWQSEKNLVKQQYLLHMSSQYGELSLLMAEIGSGVWGSPSKFQRVSRLGFVTEAKSVNGGQPNFAWCLAISWAGTLCVHFCHLLSLSGFLPAVIFSLRPTLAFSCTGIVTAWNLSSGREPNCGVVQGMELRNFRSFSFSTEGATYIPRAAITLGIGPHSSWLMCSCGKWLHWHWSLHALIVLN